MIATALLHTAAALLRLTRWHLERTAAFEAPAVARAEVVVRTALADSHRWRRRVRTWRHRQAPTSRETR
jgi:hypothetical protein